MARAGAVFGGEHSAHYYFRDFWFADTGMLAAMHVLAALGEQDAPLSELCDRVRALCRLRRDQLDRDRPGGASSSRFGPGPRCAGPRTDELDGLTVSSPEGQTPMWWFNVRASNTEPLLRLNVEAADRETMQGVRDELLALIRSGAADAATRRGRFHHRPGRRRRFVSQSQPTIEPWLREIIRCPQCKGEVIDAVATDDAAVPRSPSCAAPPASSPTPSRAASPSCSSTSPVAPTAEPVGAVFDEARLDDEDALASLDSSDTLRALAGAGAQVRRTCRAAEEAGLDRLRDVEPRGVVVAAAGGSGAVADLFEAVSRGAAALPVQSCSSGSAAGVGGRPRRRHRRVAVRSRGGHPRPRRRGSTARRLPRHGRRRGLPARRGLRAGPRRARADRRGGALLTHLGVGAGHPGAARRRRHGHRLRQPRDVVRARRPARPHGHRRAPVVRVLRQPGEGARDRARRVDAHRPRRGPLRRRHRSPGRRDVRSHRSGARRPRLPCPTPRARSSPASTGRWRRASRAAAASDDIFADPFLDGPTPAAAAAHHAARHLARRRARRSPTPSSPSPRTPVCACRSSTPRRPTRCCASPTTSPSPTSPRPTSRSASASTPRRRRTCGCCGAPAGTDRSSPPRAYAALRVPAGAGCPFQDGGASHVGCPGDASTSTWPSSAAARATRS